MVSGEKVTHYKDLKVWQAFMRLASQVYDIAAYFLKEEQFGLISQVKRSTLSIPSNIAEGTGRTGTGFMDALSLKQLLALSEEINKMLNGLITSLSAKLNSTHHSPLVTQN